MRALPISEKPYLIFGEKGRGFWLEPSRLY
jgi:hypothetical protein